MRSLTAPLLFVVICGAYASPSNLEHNSLTRYKRNVVDDLPANILLTIGELIELVKHVAKDIIIFGEAELKKYQSEIIKAVQLLYSISLHVGEYIRNIWLDTYSTMSHCVANAMNDVKRYVNMVVEVAHNCVGYPLSKVGELKQRLFDIGRNLTIESIEDFKHCSGKDMLSKVACLEKAVVDIQVNAHSLIEQDPEIKRILSDLSKYRTKCPRLAVTGVVTEALKIVSNFVHCLATPDPGNATVVPDDNTVIIHSL